LLISNYDNTAPQIIAPKNVVKDVTGVKTILTPEELGTPLVRDIVDPSPEVTNNAPVDGFPVGISNVVWTATDEAGNSAQATQKITIRDPDPPTISNLPDDIEIEAINGYGNVFNFDNPTASDLGGLLQDIECDPSPGSTFPIGMTPVLCSAVDNANLFAFDMFTVNIVASDDDSDSVINILDDEPNSFSETFGDVSLGGKTSGFVQTRGDQNLIIIDGDEQDSGVIVRTEAGGFGINDDFDCRDIDTGDIIRGAEFDGMENACFDSDGIIRSGLEELIDEDPKGDANGDGNDDDDFDELIDEDPGLQFGPEDAKISLCNQSVLVSLRDGDEASITCGSVIVKSISGSFEIEFKINDDTTASTTVNKEDNLNFDSDELTITSSPESSGENIILVGDKQFKLTPGGMLKITIDPRGKIILGGNTIVKDEIESFTFVPEDNIDEIVLESIDYELSTIVIPSEIKEPKINYKNVVTTNADGLPEVFVNPQLMVDSESSGVPFNVFIPAEALLIGTPEWDGVFNLPTVKPGSSIKLPPSDEAGKQNVAISVIEIGFNEIPLSISVPALLTFEGRADERVSYTSGGIATEITDICTGNTLEDNLGLPDNGECKISEGPHLYIWTKHLTSFSTFSSSPIPSGGGDGGDETPPDFKSISVFGARTIHEDGTLGFGGVLKQDIKFTNSMPTVLVQKGNDVSIRILINENSGKQAIKHITMYTNVAGPQSNVYNSDTFLRYDSGKITIKDTNDIFSNENISFVERGGDVEAVFEFTADKTMPLSDIIFRVWDDSRNMKETKFVDAIQIIEDSVKIMPFGGKIIELQTDEPLIDPEPESVFDTETPNQLKVQTVPEMDPEPLMSLDVLSGWAGYSNENISDSEFLNHVGIDGEKIPSWFKNKIGKWVLEGEITQQELVNALKFLNKI